MPICQLLRSPPVQRAMVAIAATTVALAARDVLETASFVPIAIVAIPVGVVG